MSEKVEKQKSLLLAHLQRMKIPVPVLLVLNRSLSNMTDEQFSEAIVTVRAIVTELENV